jgi:hypothetical protein
MHPLHEHILASNAEQSAKFVAEEAARQRYWAKHPTRFACIKCMDGRVHFPIMTKTPLGIVKPFRAIGGKFEAWWPSFLGRLRFWVEEAVSQGHRNFIFVTYHYSASDAHLGCAGWKYDTASARAHAEKLRDQLSYVFGEQVTVVAAGVETDRDNLTLHGLNDVSGESLVGKTEEAVRAAVHEAFPDMLPETVDDLLPFLVGNAACVAEMTARHLAPQDIQHNERIIAIGQGFDWMAQENIALIINDSDPNLAESVRVAATLVEKNLASLPEDQATIFVNVPYREPGMDYRQAVARCKGLRAFAERVVREAAPSLYTAGRMHTLATVKWEPARKLEVIETSY